MKKIGILFLGLISAFSFSQNTRFVYQVSMKTDSTAAPKIENAYLDISTEKSIFYGEKRMKRDSTIRQAMETRNFNFDRNSMEQFRTAITYSIEKNHATKTISYKDRIARDQYWYDEDRTFNWKILPETVKIGEYETQKAETTFAGRKWFAWFTQDLPFIDGPYKFSGLPGLIVKVEDEKGDYSFDLKETKKIAELPNFESRFGNNIKVKRSEFLKQQEKFNKDPMSFFQNQGGGGFGAPAPPQSRDNSNEADRRKRMEERLKEEAKSNNNPLEKN